MIYKNVSNQMFKNLKIKCLYYCDWVMNKEELIRVDWFERNEFYWVQMLKDKYLMKMLVSQSFEMIKKNCNSYEDFIKIQI